jgi:hypothetical protein
MSRKPSAPKPAPPATSKPEPVTIHLKDIEWMGFKDEMAQLPQPMKDEGGQALYDVQLGEDPPDWKHMTSDQERRKSGCRMRTDGIESST